MTKSQIRSMRVWSWSGAAVGADDGVGVRVVPLDQLLQAGLREIAEEQPLAEVHVTVAVDMDPAGIEKVLIRALIELAPGPPRQVRGELRHGSAAETD